MQKSSAKILPVGTVLFTSRAGIGNTAILAKEGCTNQGFQSIVPHKDELDSYFIFSRTHELKQYGETNGAGSTFMEISGKQMAKMPILIPSMEEQDKIGDFFEKLDNLITLHQCKLNHLQDEKKGLLQKMFPKKGENFPELRFPGFTDPWEQRKLGSIANVIDPHPSHRAPAATDDGIPFIGIGDVDEEGNIDYKNARIVDEKIYDEHHNRYDLSVPSIGIGRVASLGKVIRLRNDIGKYAVSPTMSVIQFYSENDLDYLYACMNTPVFQKQFKSFSNGSTRQSVGIQDLRKLMLDMPIDLEEQQKIGEFFDSLDHLITLHQRKLNHLQEQKKALLQQMFI